MFGAAEKPIPSPDGSGNQSAFSRRLSTTTGVGNNTVTSPAAGKSLRIWKFYGSSNAALTIIMQDGAGGTSIGSVTLPAAGPFSFDWTPDGALLTPGNVLNLSASAVATIEATVTGREG